MLKLLLAVILAPAAVSLFIETAKIFLSVIINPSISLPFSAGLAAYSLTHFIFGVPSRIYVAGHELTHAFSAFLSGIKVRKISVKKNSGYVKMDGSNAFTALAPYCVPFYAVLSCLVFLVISFIRNENNLTRLAVFSFGFFTAFHIINTAKTLYETKQSDLKAAGGEFFSLFVIAASNCFFILISFKILYPQTFSAQDIAEKSFLFWVHFWQTAFKWTAIAVEYVLYNIRK